MSSLFGSVKKKSQKRLCCGLGCKPSPEHGLVGYTTSLQDFFAPFSEASAPGQEETRVQRSLTAPLPLRPCTRAEESEVKQRRGLTKRLSIHFYPIRGRGWSSAAWSHKALHKMVRGLWSFQHLSSSQIPDYPRLQGCQNLPDAAGSDGKSLRTLTIQ